MRLFTAVSVCQYCKYQNHEVAQHMATQAQQKQTFIGPAA